MTHSDAPEGAAGIPAVTVIIVNYNSGPHLGRCLSALARQSFTDFEAVMVDNASTDNSIAAADDIAPPEGARFRVLRSAANLGFADGNNLAAEKSRSRWIATLNPDAYPAPDWLDRMMAATERHPDTGMFAATLLDAADPVRADGIGDVVHASGLVWRGGHGRPLPGGLTEGEVFAPCAAAAFYRRDAFDRAGGFDARYFCYIEDVDLAFRLRLSGERCILVPDAIVHHAGSAITGRHSAFTIHHSTRNLAWTFIKDMPGPLVLVLLPVHLAAMAALFLRAAIRGRARAAALGLWDALAGVPYALAQRRRIQSARRVRWWRVAAMLSWSPTAPLRRAADIRPLD